jgi:predicted O-linked N-acetylglucosamine transferase (SPINDLY family)
VALALKLARDPALLMSYRERLRANRDTFPLFDTIGYTRAIEQLLIDAWEERMKGIGATNAGPRITA